MSADAHGPDRVAGGAPSRAGGDGRARAGAGAGTHSTEVLRAPAQARPRTRVPRPLAYAIEDLTADLAPASLLGRVQTIWERATGPTIAASSSPVAERDGVLTVLCESSVWANELEMLSSELIESLNSELGSEAIVKLRCRAG